MNSYKIVFIIRRYQINKLFSKIVSVVTAAAVTVFVSSSSLQTFVNELKVNAAETDVIYGDVNGDNIVNVFDLSMIKKEINSPGSSDIRLAAADVNADDIVDVKDAVEVQDFLVGRTKGFTGSIKKSINKMDRSVVKKSISSKDLPEYCDTQVTRDIADLAERLNSPEEIFKYVANTVNTEFYSGLRKGAIGTFEQNSGNDYDQASLLLAMLKYMDYDASYYAVKANLTVDELMAMTYTDNIEAAINIYTSQGKPLSEQTDGTFETERIGIAFDYNDISYFLDPSFKKYEKNPEAIDLNSLTSEIETKYLNDNEMSLFTAAMNAESAYNAQNIADAFPQYKIIPQEFDFPSYNISDYSEDALSIVDNVELFIGDKKAFSYPAAYLYNHNLTIEYEFVKYSDEEIQEFNKMFLDSLGLNSIDDLTRNLGTYEKQVLINAVVKLDGQKIAVGEPGNLGDKEQLKINITSNGQCASVEKELTFGALYSIIFDSQIISPYEIADLYSKLPQTADEQSKINSGNIYGSDTMMNTLSLIGKTYFSQVDTNNAMLANMSNSFNSRRLSVAVVDYTPEIRNDNYVRLTGNGKIGIDVLGNWTIFKSRSNNINDETNLRHSAGFLSSELEGTVLEEMTGVRSVSTAEVLRQAAEQNIDIIQISKENLNELCSCNMSAENKADITEYANQGMIITVPKDEVIMDSWVGTGYIVYDPQTDSMLYMINNNLNGGSFCSWVTLSYVCDLAIYFVECTWAFSMIMFSISLLCLVPILGFLTLPGIIVGLLGLGSLALSGLFTYHIGTSLRDDTLLYMQYLDGDLEAGEKLKYSALDNALQAGVIMGAPKLAGGFFSKLKANKYLGPTLQKVGEALNSVGMSIGSYFSDAFAASPEGFEGALRIINRVSPSSGKAIAGFIGKFGSGFAKSLGNAYYSRGIEGVDSLLKYVEKYGETANRDFLTTTLKGADYGKSLDTYEYFDSIASKYSEDAMHYKFNSEKYVPKNEDALDVADILKRMDKAEEMYAEFRGVSDDVTAIADNTGWSIDDITTIKNHLFNDSVLKDEGYALLDPDFEIAVAWERLIEGKYYENDILLLEHELYEATYYNHFHSIKGCT